jgi:hypothetical protein
LVEHLDGVPNPWWRSSGPRDVFSCPLWVASSRADCHDGQHFVRKCELVDLLPPVRLKRCIPKGQVVNSKHSLTISYGVCIQDFKTTLILPDDVVNWRLQPVPLGPHQTCVVPSLLTPPESHSHRRGTTSGKILSCQSGLPQLQVRGLYKRAGGGGGLTIFEIHSANNRFRSQAGMIHGQVLCGSIPLVT